MRQDVEEALRLDLADDAVEEAGAARCSPPRAAWPVARHGLWISAGQSRRLG